MAKARRRPKPESRQLNKLRARVEELEETLAAISNGQVDALVLSGPHGDQVFTLQGAEHPYRVLVETMNEGAATLDVQGNVLYANAHLAEMFEVALEKFIGTPLTDQVLPGERRKLQALLDDGAQRETKGEINLKSFAGRARLIRLSLSPMKSTGLQAVALVATELTELAEANDALRSNEEALRQLSGRLLQLQDDERRHIARDLHDITGQKLAVLGISLSQVQRAKALLKDAEAQKLVSDCLVYTKQISEEIRTLSYVLHPPLLDELGLTSAIRWYTKGFEARTGIHVEIDVPANFQRLPPDVEVTLFRIMQESLTNVHRYSGSATAFVRILCSDSEVTLAVGDRGKGMRLDSTEAVVSGDTEVLGVGIQGMRERMRQLSGSLDIQSRPNQGTVVTATVPELESKLRAETEGGADRPRDDADLAEVTGAPRSGRKRILIADDHEVLRRGVRTLLGTESEWEICGEAVDGKDAVDKSAALSPDLVILDVNMPVLNGLAAVRQILRLRPQPKVLVFTVHDSDQTMMEVQATGAHGYLSKAKAQQDLIHAVKALLAGKDFYRSVPARPH
jgi:two-component system NarL family sensor kinase